MSDYINHATKGGFKMAKIIPLFPESQDHSAHTEPPRHASIADSYANITELVMLATTDRIEPCLTQNARCNQVYTEILTCTGKATGRSFAELFCDQAIEEYRNADGEALPGAVVKICARHQARWRTIAYDDPENNLAARRNYLAHILVPTAIDRVITGLNSIFVPHLNPEFTPDLAQSLKDLLKALANMNALERAPASDELREIAAELCAPKRPKENHAHL